MPAIIDYTDVYANFIPGTRVLLNGRDISLICWRAEIYEDGTGKAYCYKQRDGHPYLDETGKHAAREILTGKVEIERP